MRPISVTVGPYAAAVANGISTAQALAQAGAFLINGSLVSSGAAILDAPRQVAITSAGNDSAIFFTVTGTDASGNPLGEAVLGSNAGVVTTNNFFKRVTGVRTSGPTSSVTIGTTSGPSRSSIRSMKGLIAPPIRSPLRACSGTRPSSRLARSLAPQALRSRYPCRRFGYGFCC